jgi:hypothetical protein
MNTRHAGVLLVAIGGFEESDITAEDAERQTRTFRHRAGNLIAVILTTVKAGAAAAEDMDDTTANGSAPRRAAAVVQGTLMRETTAAVSGMPFPGRRTAGVTIAANIQSLGRGLDRGSVVEAKAVVALTPLPHTPGPRAHPHPPGLDPRTTLPDLALALAPAHTLGPAGVGRALFRRRQERVAVETETTAARRLAQEGSVMIVCLTDRVLIRGRSVIEVPAVAVRTGRRRPVRSARGLPLRTGTRAATSGPRTRLRIKRFVVCFSCFSMVRSGSNVLTTTVADESKA